MARLVELTGSYTQASHEEQDDTEDGEDAGGSHRTWKSAEDKRRRGRMGCDSVFAQKGRTAKGATGKERGGNGSGEQRG